MPAERLAETPLFRDDLKELSVSITVFCKVSWRIRQVICHAALHSASALLNRAVLRTFLFQSAGMDTVLDSSWTADVSRQMQRLQNITTKRRFVREVPESWEFRLGKIARPRFTLKQSYSPFS